MTALLIMAASAYLQQIAATITEAAEVNRIPPALALAVAWRESRFDPRATGKDGEIGLFQLMPDTARAVGYKGDLAQLYEPSLNAMYGTKYLGDMVGKYGGNLPQAVSAYNAGRPIQGNQNYVADVLYAARRFQKVLRGKKGKTVLTTLGFGFGLALLQTLRGMAYDNREPGQDESEE